jgi:hypothetical protein
MADKMGLPTADDYTEKLINTGEIKVAVDLGCGVSSLLTRFRPGVKTIGIDAHTVEVARARNVHDFYVVADIIKTSADEILDRVEQVAGTRQIDLVTFYGVIEHLPKHDGWKLLEKVEQLTSRYILLETPTGFVAQGPEFGNPYQKHLSGWYPDELRALGYDVYGTSGTRYLRGYMGEPRIRFPGVAIFDSLVLSRVLLSKRFPQHAFNFVAIKDLRGVPARYKSHEDPNRR